MVTPPTSEELNYLNQKKPDEHVDFELFKNNFLNIYEKYFKKASMNSNICPFIEVFPDLTNINYMPKGRKSPKAEVAPEAPFEANFDEDVFHFEVIEILEDAKPSYLAMDFSREHAANKLLENLDDYAVLELIGQEIEDNFALLSHLLNNFDEYKALVHGQTRINNLKLEKISNLNKILTNHGLATIDEKGLLAYILASDSSKEFEIEKRFLEDLVEEEEFLHEEKKVFCLKRATIEFYIENYIRPAARDYAKKYPSQQINSLKYSPGMQNVARSCAAALAHILGKNLAL
jgi:hypothetical protein